MNMIITSATARRGLSGGFGSGDLDELNSEKHWDRKTVRNTKRTKLHYLRSPKEYRSGGRDQLRNRVEQRTTRRDEARNRTRQVEAGREEVRNRRENEQAMRGSRMHLPRNRTDQEQLRDEEGNLIDIPYEELEENRALSNTSSEIIGEERELSISSSEGIGEARALTPSEEFEEARQRSFSQSEYEGQACAPPIDTSSLIGPMEADLPPLLSYSPFDEPPIAIMRNVLEDGNNPILVTSDQTSEDLLGPLSLSPSRKLDTCSKTDEKKPLVFESPKKKQRTSPSGSFTPLYSPQREPNYSSGSDINVQGKLRNVVGKMCDLFTELLCEQLGNQELANKFFSEAQDSTSDEASALYRYVQFEATQQRHSSSRGTRSPVTGFSQISRSSSGRKRKQSATSFSEFSDEEKVQEWLLRIPSAGKEESEISFESSGQSIPGRRRRPTSNEPIIIAKPPIISSPTHRLRPPHAAPSTPLKDLTYPEMENRPDLVGPMKQKYYRPRQNTRSPSSKTSSHSSSSLVPIVGHSPSKLPIVTPASCGSEVTEGNPPLSFEDVIESQIRDALDNSDLAEALDKLDLSQNLEERTLEDDQDLAVGISNMQLSGTQENPESESQASKASGHGVNPSKKKKRSGGKKGRKGKRGK